MELENIYMLSVGQLRELLAYACAEESVDSWWEDITEEDLESVGFYDEEDDCDYDGDSSYYDDNYDEDDELWDDEDEDYCDEEEEDDLDTCEDEVCIGGALADPAMEELAQDIAADVRAGRYALHTLNGVYSIDILNRISELI